MSDEPGAACPECGAAAERQLSGGAGFLFKGDGFYITDYRSDSYKKAAAKEKEAAKGGSGSSGPGESAASSSDASASGSSSQASPKQSGSGSTDT